MSELTLNQEIKAEVQRPLSPFGGTASEERRKDDERQVNISTARPLKRWEAGINQFAKSSWAVETAVDIQRDSILSDIEPDDAFVNSDELTHEYMKNFKLPMNRWGDMRSSKSSQEMMTKAMWYQREVVEDEEIANTLSKFERTTAIVSAAVVSPEVAVGVGVGGLYKLNTSLSKIAMLEGVSQATISAGRLAYDENYTAEDAFVDTLVGTVAAAGLTKMLRPKTVDEVRAEGAYADEMVGEWKIGASVPIRKPNTAADVISNRNSFFKTQRQMATNPKYLDEVAEGRKALDTAQQAGKKAVDDIATETKAIQKIIDDNTVALTKLTEEGATSRQIKIRENRIAKAKKELEDIEVKKANANKEHGENIRVAGQKLKDLDAPNRPLTAQQKRTEEIVTRMTDDLAEVKVQMDDIVKSNDPQFLDDYKDVVEELANKFPDEFTELRNLFRSKLNNKKVDGKYARRLTPKQTALLVAGGLTFGTTGLSAAGGQDSILPPLGIAVMLAALVGISAPALFRNIKNANTRKALIDSVKKATSSYDNAKLAMSPAGRTSETMGQAIANRAHSEFFSTVAPFIKEGGTAKQFITDILYSAEFGGGAEVLKQGWTRSMAGQYATAEKSIYKAWSIEQGLGNPSWFKSRKGIEQFREEVADVIEGAKPNSKHIQEMADATVGLRKHMWDVNKEYGTIGYDKVSFDPKMLSRLWKTGNIHDMFRGMADEDVAKIQTALENAIQKSGNKNYKEAAKNYIDSWSKVNTNVSKQNADAIFETLSQNKMLKDDVELDEVMEALTGYKDYSSRVKNRVKFEMSDFADELKGLTLDVHGVPTEMKLSTFVDRNIKSILDKNANTMYGTAALSSRGYKSVKAVREMADTITDTKLHGQANQIIDMVLGTPPAITNQLMHDLSGMLKDITIGGKLPLVAFSTPTEIIQTMSNMNIFASTKHLYKSVVKQYGEGSELQAQLSNLTGFQTSTIRLDFSHYGFSDDMVHMTDADVSNSIRRGTMKFRDAVILGSGLSTINDILQGANQTMNATKIAKMINGQDAGITASRLEGFGLTKENLDLFSPDDFKFTSSGELSKLNMDSWSVTKKDKFHEMLFNMNQQYSPETTIGETPLFAKTNDFGRMMTSLLSYSFHQYNTHGLNDLRHMDKIALSHMVGGVLGTYIGLQGRYAIQDKEIDDEKLVLYSVMNAPQMLGLSSVVSMASPATVSTTESIVQFINGEQR